MAMLRTPLSPSSGLRSLTLEIPILSLSSAQRPNLRLVMTSRVTDLMRKWIEVYSLTYSDGTTSPVKKLMRRKRAKFLKIHFTI